jgi:hypothetical protein
LRDISCFCLRDDVTDTSLCCAPIINLWGEAFWPAWVLCLVCGILLTLVSRLILSWTRLEPHLGPVGTIAGARRLIRSAYSEAAVLSM